MVKNIKAQNFSADILIVIVIILFGALFLVINKINESEEVNFEQVSQQATIDSNLIFNDLNQRNIINENNEVNVQNLLQLNEQEIRNELGIQGEFAIVFEQEGKLIKIDPTENVNCVGSSKVVVNGVPCRS